MLAFLVAALFAPIPTWAQAPGTPTASPPAAIPTPPPPPQPPAVPPTVPPLPPPAPAPPPAPPPPAEPPQRQMQAHLDDTSQGWMEIYGFVMTDMGYDFGRMDPAWTDVMRPSKLPSSADAFGADGVFFSGVRQTRTGIKAGLPTSLGELRTTFEWELFGVGADQGQTTFRLRHAYGELGRFGAGQYWSPFMDADVFPNSIEYWGPNGMAFYRNVQVRWMPIQGDTRVTFAAERPGATGDAGPAQERVDLMTIVGRYPVPDLSGELRWAGSRGYVKLSGVLRYITWDDLTNDAVDLSGQQVAWGGSVSSTVKLWGKNNLKLQATYGHGIGNYINDSPPDIGAQNNPGNAVRPLLGRALPVLGFMAFVDLYWTERWTSSVGYSMLNVDNTDAQTATALHRGQYALANLLFNPTKHSMVGGEVQWGRRDNFSDGWSYDAFKIQVSFRYNYSLKIGGKP
jgi:hypothetical protein